MKLNHALIAAAMTAALSLTACGGGGNGSSNNLPEFGNPAALSKTDITLGTGAEAVAGKTATVNYTGWLYNPNKTDSKGAQFDTSIGKTPLVFKLGAPGIIAGFDQGVTGMKVGGKRTIIIPASLGYGANGSGAIPGNAGLVFEVELLKVE
jgi:FKBP-type peptidyl-prolyl cis-trans isomerase FkpA